MEMNIEYKEIVKDNKIIITIEIDTSEKLDTEDYYLTTRDRMVRIITGKLEGFDKFSRLSCVVSLYRILNNGEI